MAAPPPPSADALVALADRCVQCGLCLPACPTYRHDRIEAESPRGRIALARAWALETIEPTAVGDVHLDHCLSCRSCEAVCPAGVQYGALLVEARTRQRERRAPGARQHAAEWLTSRPRLLGRLLGLYRMAYGLVPQAWRPLPRPPEVTGKPVATGGQDRGQVALFVGCVAKTYEAPTRAALARLLGAAGVDARIPEAQGCCGTLHAHGGNAAAAAALAERNRAAFAGSDTVLTLASGCHEAVATALQGRATVDALDFLAARADRLSFRPTAARVALHLPCSQRNVVRSVPALRRLLALVPGLEVVELTAGFGCCGASGTQMLVEPGRAASYRQPLVDEFRASGATVLLSANIGCRLHLGNAPGVAVAHPLEFLASCLA